MGILKSLLGLGVAAGAAFAAVKVVRKYDENRAADEAAEAEPFGEEDIAGAYEEIPAGQEPEETFAQEDAEAPEEEDAEAPEEEPGESRFAAVMRDLGRAAGDVLMDAGAAVKSAAQKVGVDTDELRDALQGAGSAVAHAGGAVADYVRQEAPGVIEQVREGAKDVLAQVKDAVSITIEVDDADAEPDEEEEEEEEEGKWQVFDAALDAEEAAAEAQAAAAEAEEAAAEAQAAAAEDEEDDKL